MKNDKITPTDFLYAIFTLIISIFATFVFIQQCKLQKTINEYNKIQDARIKQIQLSSYCDTLKSCDTLFHKYHDVGTIIKHSDTLKQWNGYYWVVIKVKRK